MSDWQPSTSDFDYDLPEELIAQAPIEPRDAARLLVVRRGADTAFEHKQISDLPGLLEPGDLLIVNRSRVMPARVAARLPTGGKVELLLLRRLEPTRWLALTRPARRLREGTRVGITDSLDAVVERAGEEGLREIRLEGNGVADVDAALLQVGSAPLPPYIRGWVGDPERYQTIFGEVPGSAAAPTAGLHFTPTLVDRLRAAGVRIEQVLLHVGLDTFRPVTAEDPSQHPMHREWFEVPEETRAAIRETKERGGRVIAVGTTSVRSLESWATTDEPEGWTDLFIRPGGAGFQVVDALLTNFHLPRSTLLMLVSRFAGRERILASYAEAVRLRYRFFSFGDAMLLL